MLFQGSLVPPMPYSVLSVRSEEQMWWVRGQEVATGSHKVQTEGQQRKLPISCTRQDGPQGQRTSQAGPPQERRPILIKRN